MKIVIPGGSGQVGTVLAKEYHKRGYEVVVLSRNPQKADWRNVYWDSQKMGDWIAELDGADVVINLAGKTVNCRYNQANRAEIKESRVVSTQLVGKAISRCANPPRIWLQSSTATIYAHRFDAPNDEATGIIGGKEDAVPDTWNFSIDVATSWERATEEFDLPATRKVLLRSAMTMSPDPGGIFDTLLGLVRKRLGGKSGSGKQYVSWIHETDFINALDWIIEREHLKGAINISSPNPLPNEEFMSELRNAWGIGIGLPATEWMLELGAIFMGTETELILKSRRVVPGTLLNDGFQFTYPDWGSACKELCDRWRELKNRN